MQILDKLVIRMETVIIILGFLTFVSSSENFYSFKVKDIRGQETDLFQFNGKVIQFIQIPISICHFLQVNKIPIPNMNLNP